MKGGQGFLYGGGTEDGEAEGTTLLMSVEIRAGGGAEGTLFIVMIEVGIRGGGGGTAASGGRSTIRGHTLTFGILRRNNNKK